MNRLVEFGLSADDLAALHVSELAAYILQTFDGAQQGGRVHPYSYNSDAVNTQYKGEKHVELLLALAEAWAFLHREGLVIEDPTQLQPNGWVVLTRAGREVAMHGGLKELLVQSQLPVHFLHPLIAADCHGLFLRRDFDTAVFKAFRLLEVEIRQAAGFSEHEHGVPMVRSAFRPANPSKDVMAGPLTDVAAVVSEQEALMSLMAGAVGSYKNPASHRRLQIGPDEAREMLILASHLIRIVDGRSSSQT